jgi:hypothetical protein
MSQHFFKAIDSDGNPVIQIQKGSFTLKLDKITLHILNTFAECEHDLTVNAILIIKRYTIIPMRYKIKQST